MNKKFKILIGAILPLFVFLLFLNLAQSADSPDAIAVRVLPNKDNIGTLRWYQTIVKPESQGSPQSLTVDGYEAVRDGRTVYVHAANVDKENRRFYTNIYLLSFSQTQQPATEDIFGQLLKHWKFNANLTSVEEKINARNDTRRLADLYEMNLALENYKNQHNGVYPDLAAGSYLAGKSVSVWPASWQETLGAELGVNMPKDPVNELTDCPDYADKITCWDEKNKNFYFNFNENENDPKSISGSSVYWYGDGAFHASLKTDLSLIDRCGNGLARGGEVCDGRAGVPANAACKDDCSGWECVNQDKDYGYHNEGGQCVSNIRVNDPDCGLGFDVYEKVIRTWQTNLWSTQCIVKECADGYKLTGGTPAGLLGLAVIGQCAWCRPPDGATAMKTVDNECVVAECADGKVPAADGLSCVAAGNADSPALICDNDGSCDSGENAANCESDCKKTNQACSNLPTGAKPNLAVVINQTAANNNNFTPATVYQHGGPSDVECYYECDDAAGYIWDGSKCVTNYSCQGLLPYSNFSSCANAANAANQTFAKAANNTCGTMPCTFVCTDGWTGDNCDIPPVYACGGNLPAANAQACGPATAPNQSYNYNADCDTACAYKCTGNYTGGNCSVCAPDYYGPTCGTFCSAATTCGGNGNCNSAGDCVCSKGYDPATDCSTCAAGYTGTNCQALICDNDGSCDSGENAANCESDCKKTNQACSGLPTGAKPNLAVVINQTAANNNNFTPATVYQHGGPSYAKCYYKCDEAAGFDWDADQGKCLASSCPSPAPAFANLCSGDGQGAPAGVQNTVVAACTDAVKCEYTCDAAHHLENGACVDNTYSLTVIKPATNTGTGAVTAPVGKVDGINCGADCSEDYKQGITVTLTAAPQADSSFIGWFKVSGDGYPNCGGGNPDCKITMDEAKTIVAEFMLNATLTIVKTGGPFSDIYEDDIAPDSYDTIGAAPIDCGDSCVKEYKYGTTAKLSERNKGCSKLKSWQGCDNPSGSGQYNYCSVIMDSDKTVTADFEPKPVEMDILGIGDGTGTININSTNQTCDISNQKICAKNVINCGAAVTLEAVAAVGSHFEGWRTPNISPTPVTPCDDFGPPQGISGATSGAQCNFIMEDYLGIKQGAIFCQDNHSWDGNNCVANACPANPPLYGELCTDDGKDVPGGTVNSLVTACTAQTKCEYTCDAAHHLENGACAINNYPLTVTLSGNGSGKAINTTPAAAGIDCGSGGTDCTENYNHGAAITLKATADSSSTFTGWSGACDGTGSCTVTMDAVKTVTATFTLKTFALTYTAGANGKISGDSPQTVNYGGSGTAVTAVPNTGYHFVKWSDDSTANPRTDTNVTANKTATANFGVNTYTVSTDISTGSGKFNPTSRTVNYNKTTTFTVSPNTGYRTDSVSGCGGTLSGTTYTTGAITADCAVSAAFNPTLTVTKSGYGVVTRDLDGISCGSTCSSYSSGATVILTAAPNANNTFTGWSGACSGTGACAVTMDSPKTVTATFTAGQKTYTCSGKPDNTEYYVASYNQTWNNISNSWSPADDPTPEYSATASAFNCNYECAVGYVRVGAACVLKDQSEALECGGAGLTSAELNNNSGSTQYTRITTDGGVNWSSLKSWTYNTIAGECNYICNGALGYVWNSTLGKCVINGICGTAGTSGIAYSSVPAANLLCAYGTAEVASEIDIYTFNYKDWLCPSVVNSPFSSQAVKNICIGAGSPTINTPDNLWNWTCKAPAGGGTDAVCSAPKIINGICGLFNNQKVNQSDFGAAYFRCYWGTPNNFSGTGPWTWTCEGVNGGNPASCSADKY
ncbi:MAG: InlB B-repeat-containing protein [bacterium]|nr:InlB B-repeat-containing protein [bacterium]